MKKIFGFFLMTVFFTLKINASFEGSDAAVTVYEEYPPSYDSLKKVATNEGFDSDGALKELVNLATHLSENKVSTTVVFPKYKIVLPIANDILDLAYGKYLSRVPPGYENFTDARALYGVNPLVFLSIINFREKGILYPVSDEMLKLFLLSSHLVRINEIYAMAKRMKITSYAGELELDKVLLQEILNNDYENFAQFLKDNKFKDFNSFQASKVILQEYRTIYKEEIDAEAAQIAQSLKTDKQIRKELRAAAAKGQAYITRAKCGARALLVWQKVRELYKAENSGEDQLYFGKKDGPTIHHDLNSAKQVLKSLFLSANIEEMLQREPWTLTISLEPIKKSK